MPALRSVFHLLVLMVLLPTCVLADERSDLFAALKAATDEVSGREQEDRIWRYWMKGPTSEASQLVAQAMERRRWHDFAGALPLLDKAVAAAPEWAEAWNQRAFIHFLREDYDKSLADLERVLELEPKHFAALSGKARIMMRQGRMAVGQKFLRAAIAIHPWLKERSMLITIPDQEL